MNINRFLSIIIPCLAITVLACGEPEVVEETPAPQAPAAVSPAEKKIAAVPEKEAEDPLTEPERVPDLPEEGLTVQIGELTVPRGTNNPGTGQNALMTWDEAVSWASGLDWLGRTDWRLPTDRELKEISENAERLEGYEPAEYWSSTLHPRVPDRSAVTVNFDQGKARYREKEGKNYVRVVRP